MKTDTIDFNLPPERPESLPRDCHMSQELFQNARQTMGELRDLIRESGVSWDFIRSQIEMASKHGSPIDKALARMDDYTTGTANSLHNKPSNIW